MVEDDGLVSTTVGKMETALHIMSRPFPTFPIVVASVGFLAACHEDPDPIESPLLAAQLRDSAGVLITENPLPPEGSSLGWEIGPKPTVKIGAAEGEAPHLLHDVKRAATLSDGRIVVADGASDEVRVFDPGGAHLVSCGGEGEGPGEFDALSGVARWRGDSVAAWNFHTGRGLSIFDDEGMAIEGDVVFSRSVVTADWGDLAVVSPNHDYEIRAHATDGALRRIVRLDRPLTPATRSLLMPDFEDLMRHQATWLSEEALRNERERLWPPARTSTHGTLGTHHTPARGDLGQPQPRNRRSAAGGRGGHRRACGLLSLAQPGRAAT